MSQASHAVSRLRKLYVLVLSKMRALNMRAAYRHAAASRAGSLEMMEPRVLLSGSSVNASDFKFTYVVYTDGRPSSIVEDQSQETGGGYGPFSSSSPIGLNATQIRTAYGIIPGLVGDGTGQTIAIVDAYDDPALINSDA